MSIASLESADRRESAPARSLALPLFATTIFVSAFLLFAIEPMFTKMTLPSLGGSPAVWSVAMVFFQGLMFAGYCYAHALTRWATPRGGVFLHTLVVIASFLVLPVALRAHSAPPAGGDPSLWLIGVFALSVGLPFFALSAHGPLLQAWFARSGHARAKDPYFLYGASNIGSFAALIAYPLVVEPFFGLTTQARVWTGGFLLLAVLLAACGAGVVRARAAHAVLPVTPSAAVAPITRVSAGKPLVWMGLAFAPSALLVSVTAHVSTDIAAAPLLWVLPLGLYLLTFVLAFRDPPAFGDRRLAMAQAWLAAATLMGACIGRFSILGLGLACHLALFFVNAMVCHGELYRQRPAARDLTLFYATMSFGGALGGLFAGLLAPLMFSSVAEYPLLLAAALFCRPGVVAELRGLDRGGAFRMIGTALAMLAAAGLVVATLPHDVAPKIAAVFVGALLLLAWRTPGRVAIFGLASIAAVFIVQNAVAGRETFRSFFGVHRIEAAREGKFRTLAHGTTMHGAIRVLDEDGAPVSGLPTPTTYYSPAGPLGDAVRAARALNGVLSNAAFIGLGVGALACHVEANESATYFEIDPLVVWIARDSGRFRFLRDCAPGAAFVVGDARLTLAGQAARHDLIVVDAFSSDAIPVHLLTREAFALYVEKLAPRGLIAVHVSNDHMDFSGVVARVAESLGLRARRRFDVDIAPNDPEMRTPSDVIVLARDEDLLRGLDAAGGWSELKADRGDWIWTDDYSTILSPLIARLRR